MGHQIVDIFGQKERIMFYTKAQFVLSLKQILSVLLYITICPGSTYSETLYLKELTKLVIEKQSLWSFWAYINIK